MTRASDLVQEIQDLCEDPHGDFHTQDIVLRSINRALRDISVRSRSIQDIVYYTVSAGQFRYGLHDEFLEINIVGYLYGNNPDNWYPLTRTTLGSAENLANSPNANTRPYAYDLWGRSSIEIMDSTVAEALPNNEFRPTDDIGRNVREGQRLMNATDDSEGFIEALPGTGVIRYRDLVNGVDNTMAEGDAFRIVSAHAPLHTLIVSPKPSVSNEKGDEGLWIYQTRRHRQITADDLINENDFLELDSELESALLHLACHWQRIPELGIANDEVRVHKSEYETEYHKYIPLVRNRINQNMNAWKIAAHNTRVAYASNPAGDELISSDVLFNRYNIWSR